MIDRIFSAVLTFALLLGGTLAIGSELFGMNRQHTVRVVQLQPVVIVAKRLAPNANVATRERDEPAASRLQ
jgi:hypothetical protein